MKNNIPQELDIINISDYGDALRNSGYKNIESAMAEIIDNSLEAKASNVLVIIKDKVPPWGRKSQVYEVAFLDDGSGMTPEWVQKCLRFGSGTRQSRKGMGRFGVGLPQSSLYACPRVEVYSWQNGIESCYFSVLDIDKVNDGEQLKLPPAEKSEIPNEYMKYLSPTLSLVENTFDFSKSGTLILWKNCDNVEPRTVSPLFSRLELAFGQKYRYLIQNNTKSIYLIHDTKDQYNKKVLPNDPLFLMKNNIALGNPNNVTALSLRNNTEFTEPLFKPYDTLLYPDGIVPVTIKYFDNETKTAKEGTVTLKFSIVKEEFYDQDHMTAPNPGSTEMGTFVGKHEGISVVRKGREIDFGEFSFYSDKNSPFHRWWGCEISFEPELDEVFKVSNNKQHVELIELSGADYEEEEYKPVWLQLEKIVTDTIKKMQERNKLLRKGSRTEGARPTTPVEETATKADQDESPTETQSREVREEKTETELEKTAEDILIQRGNENPSPEDIQNILLQTVLLQEKPLGDTPYLFSFEVDTGFCICTINTNHIYYKKYIEAMEGEAQDAFKLLIASFVKTVDEAPREKRRIYRDLMHDWNYKMHKYIQTFLGVE